jgi:hypothetical protein
MKNYLIKTVISFCALLCFGICYGQSNADNLQNRPVLTTTINNYNVAIGQQSLVYNGVGYALIRKMKGNPHFMDTTATTNGSVVYYGETYPNIPLLYDINRDLLVSVWVDGTSLYSFTSDRLSEFTLLKHHFIRLNPDSVAQKVVKAGFYDDLYTHKLQVLAKRQKIIHIAGTLLSTDDYFDPKVYYYLKKNGRYFTISGEGDMLDVLQDRKKELKDYIKSNKIKYRNDPESFMVMLATYYDQLTN